MKDEKKKAAKKKVDAAPEQEESAVAIMDAPEDEDSEAVVGTVEAVDAEFAEFEPGAFLSDEVPMSMLMDLSLPISIELGRTTMTVQEILRLGRGAVVQLDRLAGEPVDVFVGNRRFAEGEVVVLGEHFGVRITQILTSLSGESLD